MFCLTHHLIFSSCSQQSSFSSVSFCSYIMFTNLTNDIILPEDTQFLQSFPHSVAILLELPFSVVKWAYLSGLQPARNAVEMECMITNSPCNCTLFTGGWCLVSLAFNTEIHDMISADGTIVNHNIPSPQSHSIPFFNFKSLFVAFIAWSHTE